MARVHTLSSHCSELSTSFAHFLLLLPAATWDCLCGLCSLPFVGRVLGELGKQKCGGIESDGVSQQNCCRLLIQGRCCMHDRRPGIGNGQAAGSVWPHSRRMFLWRVLEVDMLVPAGNECLIRNNVTTGAYRRLSTITVLHSHQLWQPQQRCPPFRLFVRHIDLSRPLFQIVVHWGCFATNQEWLAGWSFLQRYGSQPSAPLNNHPYRRTSSYIRSFFFISSLETDTYSRVRHLRPVADPPRLRTTCHKRYMGRTFCFYTFVVACSLDANDAERPQ